MSSIARFVNRKVVLHYVPLSTLSRNVANNAKKKKKGGGKGGVKGSLFGELDKKPLVEPWQTTDIIMQHLLMVESYRRAAGKPLMQSVEMEAITEVMYNAPFAILAHNRFKAGVADEDAVFTFANKLALEAFEARTWGELVGQPSRSCILDGDTGSAATREDALHDVLERGNEALALVPGAWRRSTKGNRFFVEEFHLWNISSPTGIVVGQAAWFDTIRREDGTVVKLGPNGAVAQVPASEDRVSELEGLVAEQAAAVRALKEEGGRGNSDPDVQDAVAELLRRKEGLASARAALEKRLADAALDDSPVS